MLSITHAALSCCTVSLVLGTADAGVLSIALLSSQLPDLDKTDSLIGRILLPVSTWIESRYSHRTVTHSFAATVAIALCGLPLFLLGWQHWLALVIAQFMGWFADCFTKAGCAAFWPNPARMVIPGNPRVRLRTGSTYEYGVMGMAIALLIISINLSSNGGLTEQFARSFFQDTATAAQLFGRYGAERTVLVDVVGLHQHTSQAVEATYIVIEATTSEITGEEVVSHKLYQIGAGSDVQIRARRVKARLGGAIALEVHSYQVSEIGVDDFIAQIPPAAYISGALLLDDLEDVQLPLEMESFATVRVFGGQVELRNARPAEVSGVLGGHWIVAGKVLVKTRVEVSP